jgi:Uma2 family endonuclease
MRVRLAFDNRYVYPDLTVVCGEPEFDPLDEKQTTIINPRLVVEVLSGSTEAYDRGVKFAAYRELKSFQEYVLISQDQPLVETFLRQADGTWVLAAARGLEGSMTLRSLQIVVPLAEIYMGITFTDLKAEVPPPT